MLFFSIGLGSTLADSPIVLTQKPCSFFHFLAKRFDLATYRRGGLRERENFDLLLNPVTTVDQDREFWDRHGWFLTLQYVRF